MPSLRPYVEELATAGLPDAAGPFRKSSISTTKIDDDAFAELAWPHCQAADRHPGRRPGGLRQPVAEAQGWKVIVPDELQAKGIAYLVDQILKGMQGA